MVQTVLEATDVAHCIHLFGHYKGLFLNLLLPMLCGFALLPPFGGTQVNYLNQATVISDHALREYRSLCVHVDQTPALIFYLSA